MMRCAIQQRARGGHPGARGARRRHPRVTTTPAWNTAPVTQDVPASWTTALATSVAVSSANDLGSNIPTLLTNLHAPSVATDDRSRPTNDGSRHPSRHKEKNHEKIQNTDSVQSRRLTHQNSGMGLGLRTQHPDGEWPGGLGPHPNQKHSGENFPENACFDSSSGSTLNHTVTLLQGRGCRPPVGRYDPTRPVQDHDRHHQLDGQGRSLRAATFTESPEPATAKFLSAYAF